MRNGKLGRGRLAELRGILAEANTAMAATLRSQKKPSDRFDVWWWRFRRHLTRDLPYIGSVALGGAVGTSLGLGVLRAVLATSLSETPGYAFYGAFPMGFLFGLAVSLGLLLVNPIRLHPPEHGTASAGRRPLLPAVGLGRPVLLPDGGAAPRPLRAAPPGHTAARTPAGPVAGRRPELLLDAGVAHGPFQPACPSR